METKFNSQICTTREQSERLLALGLRKETADMVHYFSQSLAQDWTIVPLADGESARYIQGLEIPAWSLHRLIEMMPNKIDAPTKGHYFRVQYYNSIAYEFGDYSIARFRRENLYDNIIDCIEWLIKEGYFNKEYLV